MSEQPSEVKYESLTPIQLEANRLWQQDMRAMCGLGPDAEASDAFLWGAHVCGMDPSAPVYEPQFKDRRVSSESNPFVTVAEVEALVSGPPGPMSCFVKLPDVPGLKPASLTDTGPTVQHASVLPCDTSGPQDRQACASIPDHRSHSTGARPQELLPAAASIRDAEAGDASSASGARVPADAGALCTVEAPESAAGSSALPSVRPPPLLFPNVKADIFHPDHPMFAIGSDKVEVQIEEVARFDNESSYPKPKKVEDMLKFFFQALIDANKELRPDGTLGQATASQVYLRACKIFQKGRVADMRILPTAGGCGDLHDEVNEDILHRLLGTKPAAATGAAAGAPASDSSGKAAELEAACFPIVVSARKLHKGEILWPPLGWCKLSEPKARRPRQQQRSTAEAPDHTSSRIAALYSELRHHADIMFSCNTRAKDSAVFTAIAPGCTNVASLIPCNFKEVREPLGWRKFKVKVSRLGERAAFQIVFLENTEDREKDCPLVRQHPAQLDDTPNATLHHYELSYQTTYLAMLNLLQQRRLREIGQEEKRLAAKAADHAVHERKLLTVQTEVWQAKKNVIATQQAQQEIHRKFERLKRERAQLERRFELLVHQAQQLEAWPLSLAHERRTVSSEVRCWLATMRRLDLLRSWNSAGRIMLVRHGRTWSEALSNARTSIAPMDADDHQGPPVSESSDSEFEEDDLTDAGSLASRYSKTSRGSQNSQQAAELLQNIILDIDSSSKTISKYNSMEARLHTTVLQAWNRHGPTRLVHLTSSTGDASKLACLNYMNGAFDCPPDAGHEEAHVQMLHTLKQQRSLFWAAIAQLVLQIHPLTLQSCARACSTMPAVDGLESSTRIAAGSEHVAPGASSSSDGRTHSTSTVDRKAGLCFSAIDVPCPALHDLCAAAAAVAAEAAALKTDTVTSIGSERTVCNSRDLASCHPNGDLLLAQSIPGHQPKCSPWAMLHVQRAWAVLCVSHQHTPLLALTTEQVPVPARDMAQQVLQFQKSLKADSPCVPLDGAVGKPTSSLAQLSESAQHRLRVLHPCDALLVAAMCQRAVAATSASPALGRAPPDALMQTQARLFAAAAPGKAAYLAAGGTAEPLRLTSLNFADRDVRRLKRVDSEITWTMSKTELHYFMNDIPVWNLLLCLREWLVRAVHAVDLVIGTAAADKFAVSGKRTAAIAQRLDERVLQARKTDHKHAFRGGHYFLRGLRIVDEICTLCEPVARVTRSLQINRDRLIKVRSGHVTSVQVGQLSSMIFQFELWLADTPSMVDTLRLLAKTAESDHEKEASPAASANGQF